MLGTDDDAKPSVTVIERRHVILSERVPVSVVTENRDEYDGMDGVLLCSIEVLITLAAAGDEPERDAAIVASSDGDEQGLLSGRDRQGSSLHVSGCVRVRVVNGLIDPRRIRNTLS